MLRKTGHTVEVFAGSEKRQGSLDEEDVRVHRVQLCERYMFPLKAGLAFAERHLRAPFDVVEGPEFGAEASGALKSVPDIPLVVKLHTPGFLIRQLNRDRSSVYARVRASMKRTLGTLRRRGFLRQDNDYERSHVLAADEITSPSASLADLIAGEWRIPRSQIVHLPNPYVPSPDLLALSPLVGEKVVTFVGRLETRKGVLDLASAIPIVLGRMPDTKFRLIGRASQSPDPARDMRRYLEDSLSEYRSAVEFIDHVSLDKIPAYLGGTSICVVPSLWENFPNVCLEAMAAGRAVVASNAGGMTDMLDNGKAGLLVPPGAPGMIADAILRLLADPARMRRYGEAARARVLTQYSIDRIARLQEASYVRAIERRRRAGSR
jgi:glycosyltransferase involved in cell wall biosynthesis